MRALVVDAYDSFVYVIDQYLQTLGVETIVRRNDIVTPAVIDEVNPDFVVLGPGPGHPSEAGYVELLQAKSESLPMLGICLGHQAIGLAFGAQIDRAEHLMHGKTSVIRHDGKGVFAGHAPSFHATRYHSLVVNSESIPPELIVSATAAEDGYTMGMRHTSRPVESVQFHPESILTEQGMALFRNFITQYVGELEEFEDEDDLR